MAAAIVIQSVSPEDTDDDPYEGKNSERRNRVLAILVR
jgi:hypothetical protein